jgi:hypothetical protein
MVIREFAGGNVKKGRAVLPRFGRVLIEIVPHSPAGLEASVTRTCDKPEIVGLAEALVNELVRLSPGIVITRGPMETKTVTSKSIGRRGGPIATPEDQKLKVVKGWLRAQGRLNQEIYAQSRGIAPSTLRRWIHQLRQAGKL